MGTPNVSYSVSIRVSLKHSPGALGRLTTAIGEAGGNILGLDMIDVADDRMVRDITVLAVDDEHVARITKAIEAMGEVTVHSVLDRTFRMHVGGKIEVTSKSPLATPDGHLSANNIWPVGARE